MQFQKKHCVAMLLAGGQGSRLKVLTENTAKPAVPFGGKYRIIDFTLSNCVNSKIDTVGILTQYLPLEVNEYIGNGQPWGLNSSHGGVQILPPYARSKKSEWYKGTANAIYQNFSFIERYDPDLVLVLSGDHIYRMDYSAMIRHHEEVGADATIAVRDVPISEASRFGIMNTKEDGSIYEFEEKPKEPKSTHASMGIYVFSWPILREYLSEDEADENSDHDFGKNVIPAMLDAGQKMYTYKFDGYWKDVGTIQSLWEANMDLLGKEPEFDIHGQGDKKFYARNTAMPPSYISDDAEIDDSFVTEGCEIEGTVKHSIISTGCIIGKRSTVTDSVVMPNVVIDDDVTVNGAIIAEDCHIMDGARLGPPYDTKAEKISVVGKEKVIGINEVVNEGEII